MNETEKIYSLDELCVLVEFTKRTIRYYIQQGLVARPIGETRSAHYTSGHLEQLLLIKKWTAAGVSLERIRELLHGEQAPVSFRPRAAGSVEVCSHLTVTDGIEVVIEPGRAGLSPEQVRSFIKGVMSVFAEVTSGQADQAVQEQQQKLKGDGHEPE